MKTYSELLDDLVEAVDHANKCDADLARVRAELDDAKRIVGALVARRSQGHRIEREELEQAPKYAARWADDVLVLSAKVEP